MAQHQPRRRLIQRREELGLTRAQVAEALRYDPSAYSRLEAGRSKIRVGRRPALAQILKWSPAQLAIALDGGDPDAPAPQQIAERLTLYGSLEQGASLVQAFEPWAVHGLLQTPDYAEAVERTGLGVTDAGVAQLVAMRISRQQVLARDPDPLRLHVVLDESALRRVTGGLEVMADQLDHLGDVAESPDITVQVLSLDPATHAAAGSFTLLSSGPGGGARVLILSDLSGIRYLESPDLVDTHAALFDHLRDSAHSPSASLDLIRRIAKETRP